MSGVWVFRNGVVRLIENPVPNDSARRKLLVHVPSNEVITSYDTLERRLRELGWERYRSPRADVSGLIQFHRQSSQDLISLPQDFSRFRTVHMYDIVVKSRNVFEVRDFVVQ